MVEYISSPEQFSRRCNINAKVATYCGIPYKYNTRKMRWVVVSDDEMNWTIRMGKVFPDVLVQIRKEKT